MPYKDTKTQKKAQRAWYLRNRDTIAARSREQRQRNKEWLRQQKDQPCQDCNLKWPPYIMEYHHRDSAEKLGSISNMLTKCSRSKIEAEIAKCDLICSNCHRIRTYES